MWFATIRALQLLNLKKKGRMDVINENANCICNFKDIFVGFFFPFFSPGVRLDFGFYPEEMKTSHPNQQYKLNF